MSKKTHTQSNVMSISHYIFSSAGKQAKSQDKFVVLHYNILRYKKKILRCKNDEQSAITHF
jgi:hypothetical protein